MSEANIFVKLASIARSRKLVRDACISDAAKSKLLSELDDEEKKLSSSLESQSAAPKKG